MVIYALDLALEEFDVSNEVPPQSKFPCGALRHNWWVNPN